MTRAIWKFHLPVVPRLILQMPMAATVLSVGNQREEINLWALVSPTAPVETRVFAVIGTGHPLPPEADAKWKFLGTVPLMGGSLMFHVFEVL